MMRLIKRAHFGTKAIYLLHLGAVATSCLSIQNTAKLVLTLLRKQLTFLTIKENATLLQIPEAKPSVEATQDGSKQVTSIVELAVYSQKFKRTAHMDMLILAPVGVDLYSVACAAVVSHRVVEQMHNLEAPLLQIVVVESLGQPPYQPVRLLSEKEFGDESDHVIQTCFNR